MTTNVENIDNALRAAVKAGETAALEVWDRDGHVDRGSCGGAMLELDQRSKLFKRASILGLIGFEGFVMLRTPDGIASQNADIQQSQYRAFREALTEAGFGKAVKRFWTYVD